MLYYLLRSLRDEFPAFNVARYITFRTAAASITALAISLLMGPWLIRKLREFQIGQIIRQAGPESHKAKAGTPTMGGLLILASALVPTLLWADLTNAYVWIAVVATAAFGGVGFLDDYLKVVRRTHHGLAPRFKLLGQFAIALLVGVALLVLAETRIERILASVHEGTMAARYNWMLTPLATLFFPPDPHAANQAALASVSEQLSANPSRAPEVLWVRVERQTLRRLRPVGTPVPADMVPLVQSIDLFMTRLEGSTTLLRSFIAEAAHQMRTPLAALRVQAQLALDEDDPAEQRRTLHALLVCSASTFLVFLLLALSALPVLRAIGLPVTLGVALNFLLALLWTRRREVPRAS